MEGSAATTEAMEGSAATTEAIKESATTTEAVYLEDTYLFETAARIIRITEETQPKHGKHCVVVDRTVFHPQGGGQLCCVAVHGMML